MVKDPQLFPDPPRSQPEPKAPPPKSVAWGMCPAHPFVFTLTGLIRGGNHLYWRLHHVTQGRNVRVCTASNAPLHAMPALDATGHTTPTCPCGV